MEEFAGESKSVYSVWAIPPDGVRDRLKRLMSSLRAEFGGPAFDLHITVVGAVRISHSDALLRLRAAAATGDLRPYAARVAAVSRGDSFYQCVYLLIDPTPEVLEASSHCCGHFEYRSSSCEFEGKFNLRSYSSFSDLIHDVSFFFFVMAEEKEAVRLRAEELAVADDLKRD